MSVSTFKICRLCIKNAITTFSLNSRDLNNIQLIDKLKYVLPEIINDDCIMSNEICTTCYTDLERSYLFRKNCLDAYKRFKNNINSDNTQIILDANMQKHILQLVDQNTIKPDANVNKIFCPSASKGIQIILDSSVQSQILNLVDQNESVNFDNKISNNESTDCENVVSIEPEIKNYKKLENLKENENAKPSEKKRNVRIWRTVPNPQNYTEHKAYDPANPSKKVYFIKDFTSNVFYCKSCNKLFRKFPTLYTHLNRKHFACGEESILDNLERNILQSTCSKILIPSSVFKCTHCDYKCNKQNLLDAHLSQEHKFKCNQCPKMFRFHYEIKEHRKSHKGEQSSVTKSKETVIYQCEHCDYKCTRRNILGKHTLKKHGVKLKVEYRCDICAKIVTTYHGLQVHKLTHLKNENKDCATVCYICGWVGNTASKLSKHMRIKHGDVKNAQEKTYQMKVCPICSKTVTTKNYCYTYHMKRHDQRSWKYHCEVCGRKFFGKTELTIHLRIHSGERPFKCEICGKSFYMKSTLKNHLYTHTGVKRYQCDICGNKYAQKQTLKQHKQNVHVANLEQIM